MMIDVMTLLIMACCVSSGLSIAFMFYSYHHPDKVPFMQGFFNIFKKKDDKDEDEDEDTLYSTPTPTATPLPTTCLVTAADRAAWQQQCANNQQCIAQQQSRKCGPLPVVSDASMALRRL